MASDLVGCPAGPQYASLRRDGGSAVQMAAYRGQRLLNPASAAGSLFATMSRSRRLTDLGYGSVSRAPSTTPQQRAHPDFPLRAFVRCESCGRGLTGWSKGRSEYCAYYHCRPGCRVVNVTKAKLEGLFADELALLQPSPGYMRLLKESVLQIWKARKATAREELANAERVCQSDPGEAGPSRRGIPLRPVDRHRDVRSPCREIARGAHARPDRPSLRPTL